MINGHVKSFTDFLNEGYMKDLIIHWSTAKINFSTEPTDNLIYHLHQLLVLRKDFEDSIIKN